MAHENTFSLLTGPSGLISLSFLFINLVNSLLTTAYPLVSATHLIAMLFIYFLEFDATGFCDFVNLVVF